jgi:methyl-accepting chemotaxis protein
MNGLLSQFSIRQKLWFAAATIVGTVLVISAMVLSNMSEVEGSVTRVVEQVQPAMKGALEVKSLLHATAANMGLYLKSPGPRYRDTYNESLDQLLAGLRQYRQLQDRIEEPEMARLFDRLEKKVARIVGYRERILELGSDPVKNITALAIMSEKANPYILQAAQLLKDMINAELQEEVSSDRRDLLRQIEDVRYNLVQAVSAARGYIGLRVPVFQENIGIYLQEFEKGMDLLGDYADDFNFEQEVAFDQLQKIARTYTDGIQEVLRVHSSEQAYQDVNLIRSELGPLLAETTDLAEQLGKELGGLSEASGAEMTQLITDSRNRLIVLLGVALSLILAMTALISHDISGKLGKSVAAMRVIAGGEGDLTRKLDARGRDEMAQLGEAFNQFVDKIAKTIEHVHDSVSELDQATVALSHIADSTSGSMEQQHQVSAELVDGVAALQGSAGRLAHILSGTREKTATAMQAANTGNYLVNDTNQSIDELNGKVENASTIINQLDKDSDSIGTVLDVIRGIAEQTNLLALNAAIEAARAGEQGRGFAVVADEVRTLAGRTQESTEEIQKTIEKLQRASRQAVAAIESGKQTAGNTLDQFQQTRQSFSDIIEAVGAIDAMGEEIGGFSEDQSRVVGNLSRQIERIAGIAKQTSEDAERVGGSVAGLGRLTEKLKGLVSSFRL